MINKKAHHVKQPRHPADYKNDMNGENVLVHEAEPPNPLKGELFDLHYLFYPNDNSPFRGSGGLIPVFLYNFYRVLYIIKRDIGHNAMTQVEDEAGLVFHPVEQAVDAVFNYFFIGV